MISPLHPRFRGPASVCLLLLLCGAPPAAQAAEPQTFPDFRVPIRSPSDTPIILPAAAENSGLPLTWTVAAGPVTVSGNIATFTGKLGGVTLRATQPGNAEWEPLEQFVTFPVTEEGAYQEVSGLSGLSTTSQMLAINQAGRMIKISRQAKPVAVWTDMRWKTVSSGRYQLAVSRDGRLFSWGRASSGELGHGLIREELVAPLQVGTDTDWSQACAGPAISAAIKKNGTLWAWGAPFRPDMGVPRQIGAFTDWKGLSSDGAETLAMARSNGLIYGPDFTWFRSASTITDWDKISSSAGGLLGIRKDGSLWNARLNEARRISADTDWLEASVGRTHYLARRANGSLWVGGLQGYGYPGGPMELTTDDRRWRFLHSGYFHSALVSEDGGLWMLAQYGFPPAAGTPKYEFALNQYGALGVATLYRLAPDYAPQTLPFLENRERPFPVVTGSTLRVGAAECTSGMPPQIAIHSGAAILDGDAITFTRDGPVEITFSRKGDETWTELQERVTFLAGPAGPEIAVHDGPHLATPPRQSGSPEIQLGRHTKTRALAGFTRSFILHNTGSSPLHVTDITGETASPLVFTATPAGAFVILPGGSLPLELYLNCAEYGSHALTVVLSTDDADEPAYRLPITLNVSNSGPVASAGPDRVIPAGRAVLLDAARFTTDPDEPPADLRYTWDLDGGGFTLEGAGQAITLERPGQSRILRLRARDMDGAESIDECVLTACPVDMIPPAAIRLTPPFAELTFPGVPGVVYRVERSRDLLEWEGAFFANPADYHPECGPDGFFSVKTSLYSTDSSAFFRAVAW